MRRNGQQLTFLNTTEDTSNDESRLVTGSVVPTSPEDVCTQPGVAITRSGCV